MRQRPRLASFQSSGRHHRRSRSPGAVCDAGVPRTSRTLCSTRAMGAELRGRREPDLGNHALSARRQAGRAVGVRRDPAGGGRAGARLGEQQRPEPHGGSRRRGASGHGGAGRRQRARGSLPPHDGRGGAGAPGLGGAISDRVVPLPGERVGGASGLGVLLRTASLHRIYEFDPLLCRRACPGGNSGPGPPGLQWRPCEAG